MRYPPIVPNYPQMLHGGDYNPDQWQEAPDVLEEDLRLARLAGVNSFSLAIFAWAALEPAEGRFEFGWLDRILDRMAAEGMKAVLATPSGAKPNWMAARYPEIRRVGPDGHREPQQGRHNHCLTSPVYREKVTILNSQLAERYANHEALGVWHLSNEYSGECRCELCKAAFRVWLQRKHGTLAKLNAAWWTAFWAHTYTDWSQVDALDSSVHGLILDWKRFVSDQTTDFIRTEIAPLKRFTPHVPVTTNLMGIYLGLDYRRMARELDVISWDNYPPYHARAEMAEMGAGTSFAHDLNRSLKGGRPFLMMESSPSATNWMGVNKLLRPGIHRLKSLQAVAHGADSVQYFQYRKSRGSSEKFHGAVVDHVGHENTRVFRDVAEVGQALKALRGAVGFPTPAQVAIVYDWENRWVLSEVQGPPRAGNNGWAGSALFEGWVQAHYRAFWQRGIAVDVVGQDDDLSRYTLVVAPMLYLLKPGTAERLSEFVRNGGTLVGTFLTGIADENDLVFLGGWPGPLRPLFGVWAEEIDYLYPDESNRLMPEGALAATARGPYKVTAACDLIHAESADVLATYGDDFYAGRPCLTVNRVGKGQAFYLACRAEERFLEDFYAGLESSLGLRRALAGDLPRGVTAQVRSDGKRDFVFVLNFTREAQEIAVGEGVKDVLAGGAVTDPVRLEPYGVRVFERPAR
jgi:beta-galactosidase